jgi:flagellar hook-associated protein 2
MQVEAAPQTRLKAKVSSAETAVSSYQSVNSKVSAMETAGDTLTQLSTWRAIKATSTSPTVTATAVTGTNTTTGTTTFDVWKLAKNQVTTARVATSGDVTSGGSMTVTIGPADVYDGLGNLVTDNSSERTDHTITLTDLTAKGVADAINAKGIGVKATVVTTGGAENVLQFSGTKTGSDNAFTISGFDPVTSDVTPAQNAVLKIAGGEGAGGYDVISSTNTFTGLLTGVTVTVSKEESGVTIDATSDVNGIADKFQALVDAANAALSEIKTQTAYDPASNKGSPLTGDFSVRSMVQTILGTISQGVIYPNPDYDLDKTPEQQPGVPKTLSGGPYATYGIELTSAGALVFDADKFKAAYNADPTGIQKVGTGIGEVFESMAKTQSTSLTSVITGRKSEIDIFNSQISNWDVRLAAKRVALQKQYATLEVSLGKLKNQSNWLAGQLGGLS